MFLRKLSFGDGSPLWINPENVVSVSEYRGYRNDGVEYDGPLTSLQLVQPDNGWIIRGALEEVLAILDGRGVTEEFYRKANTK